MTQPDPPQTLPQAVERLLAHLSAEEQERLRATKKENLIDLHLSLGMWIRNSFPIWANEALLRSCAIERNRQIAAWMEAESAKTGEQQKNASRDCLSRLLQQKSVHPDDASDIIVRVAWERLQEKQAGEVAPDDHRPLRPEQAGPRG
jgi:hypothetical protein